jgi:hypothetical protein
LGAYTFLASTLAASLFFSTGALVVAEDAASIYLTLNLNYK